MKILLGLIFLFSYGIALAGTVKNSSETKKKYNDNRAFSVEIGYGAFHPSLQGVMLRSWFANFRDVDIGLQYFGAKRTNDDLDESQFLSRDSLNVGEININELILLGNFKFLDKFYFDIGAGIRKASSKYDVSIEQIWSHSAPYNKALSGSQESSSSILTVMLGNKFTLKNRFILGMDWIGYTFVQRKYSKNTGHCENHIQSCNKFDHISNQVKNRVSRLGSESNIRHSVIYLGLQF